VQQFICLARWREYRGANPFPSSARSPSDAFVRGDHGAGTVEQQEAKELKRDLRGVFLVEATLSNGRWWASGRRSGDACASGTKRLAFLLRRIGRGKIRLRLRQRYGRPVVVCVPEAECVAAPGRLHAISTRPPLPRFSRGAIARFKGSMPFLAITFFDTRTLAPIAMSAILARGTYRFDHLDHEARAEVELDDAALAVPCRPTVPLLESGVWVLRRCDSFIYGTRRPADGARPPDGSRTAAATRRTASRARCRAGSRACRRRAPAGWERPGRQSLRDPPGSRFG
jgi:hypothetical protein